MDTDNRRGRVVNHEDRLEMASHLNQEALLHRHGFDLIPEKGGERGQCD